MTFPRFRSGAKGGGRLDRDAAEAIGLRALAFLAEDGERLGRFLSLSGIGPEELRAHAGDPALLAAVLAHLLDDEASLLMFAANSDLRAQDIEPARALLAGEGGSFGS